MATTQNMTTGRRKQSVARVRLLPGDGSIVVNGKPAGEYFSAALATSIISGENTATAPIVS